MEAMADNIRIFFIIYLFVISLTNVTQGQT
jgi:hypothetical protein